MRKTCILDFIPFKKMRFANNFCGFIHGITKNKNIKMDSNILCKFESKMCMLCGINGINQYFEIGRNFIEYNGVYHSLHEILNEALNFNVGKC